MQRNGTIFGGVFAAAVAASAGASIVSVSGEVEHVLAPSDARLNAFTSADYIRAWDERQNVTLGAHLLVDAVNPGVYDAKGDLGNYAIAPGVMINSHYIHFDSPGNKSATASGSVTFADRIIGVIVKGDNKNDFFGKLDLSDYLGAPLTLYADKVANRGLEMGSDKFAISADGRTLEILRFGISKPGDYVRVVTEVPAPASLACLGGAGLMCLRRRRA